MTDQNSAQIYLLTPLDADRPGFADTLACVLDAVPVACLRLALATREADAISRTADALRLVAHGRDVPLVIEAHAGLVGKLGLDGVHLTDGGRSVRATRKSLGADAIIGAFCGTARHDGMTAGEAGADYVAFGPVGDTGLGDATLADRDLFAWWSEMIELPVVAEGGLDTARIAHLAPVTDFFAFGSEIWQTDDPANTLKGFFGAIS